MTRTQQINIFSFIPVNKLFHRLSILSKHTIHSKIDNVYEFVHNYGN